MTTFTDQASSSTWKVAVPNNNPFSLTNNGPGDLKYAFASNWPDANVSGHILKRGETVYRESRCGKLFVAGVNGDVRYTVTTNPTPQPLPNLQAKAAGNRYYMEVVSGSIAAAGTFDVFLTTGEFPVYLDFIRTRKPDGEYTVDFYEDAVIGSPTPTIPTNLNRQSSRAISGSYGVAGSVSDVGTFLLPVTHLEAVDRSGVVGEWNDAMVLKANTTYLIRYTNDDATATSFAATYIMQEMRA